MTIAKNERMEKFTDGGIQDFHALEIKEAVEKVDGFANHMLVLEFDTSHHADQLAITALDDVSSLTISDSSLSLNLLSTSKHDKMLFTMPNQDTCTSSPFTRQTNSNPMPMFIRRNDSVNNKMYIPIFFPENVNEMYDSPDALAELVENEVQRLLQAYEVAEDYKGRDSFEDFLESHDFNVQLITFLKDFLDGEKNNDSDLTVKPSSPGRHPMDLM